jgi:hypothetical protein
VRLANPGLARSLMASPDFYTTSGCHDLLFHVMEHRFTIPRVAEFLAANDLTFLGFRLGTDAMEKFRADFPDAEADLGAWHAFEQANPHTFAAMYRFAVRKILRPGCVTPFSGASKNRTGPTEAS